jgi:hypothetical protein
LPQFGQEVEPAGNAHDYDQVLVALGDTEFSLTVEGKTTNKWKRGPESMAILNERVSATPCVVSVAEHAGWAHLVCVALVEGTPAVIERRRVTLIDEQLPRMPYHHESLAMTEDDANALIARVQRSVASHASIALRSVATDLAPAHVVVALAIREPVFPGLPASVADVRRSYRLQCAADGVMYQLAVCDAARAFGLEVHACPRGKELARAAERLGLAPGDIESFVAGEGRPIGAPWTLDHRLAFAAGIAALPIELPARIPSAASARR